ncbi:hypothetical protein X975_22661, partial [Stegodyphus mimosarum]
MTWWILTFLLFFSAVLRIEPGSSLRAYAQEIAELTVRILLSKNLLTSKAVALARTSVQNAIATALETSAAQEISAAGTVSTSADTSVEAGSRRTGILPGVTAYVARDGASDIEEAFGSHLYGTLLVNPRFSTLFGSEFSLEKVRPFLFALASHIHSFSQFSSISANDLFERYIEVVNALPLGSSVQAYALALSQATAELLYENNLLSWDALAKEDAEAAGAGEAQATVSSTLVSSSTVESAAAETAASAILSPSVLSILSSSESEKRIASLISVIISSLPAPGGKFDYLTFARGLASLLSDIRAGNPSYSASDVITEGLLEALVAFIQMEEYITLSDRPIEYSDYVTKAISDSLNVAFKSQQLI